MFILNQNFVFFENNKGDIIVSNPPFSLVKDIMPRLKELDKPFILLMPSSKINTQYIRENFKNKDFKIIIPRKRIQFDKMVNGVIDDSKNCCNFDCFYYCYKIDLPYSIIWLE